MADPSGMWHYGIQNTVSRMFIPTNDTTYLAGHVDGHVRTNLSGNSLLQS